MDIYDRLILSRMWEFFTLDGLPWPRRLWDVGSLLALDELHEAAGWARQKVLTASAVDWHRHSLAAVVGPDIGLGAKDLRKEVTAILAKPILDPSPERRRLRALIERARPGYLQRWADSLTLPAERRPRPERLARLIASHLLDLGYDAEYLQAWARSLMKTTSTAEAMLADAVNLDQANQQSYDVVIALLNTPDQTSAEAQAEWLPADRLIAWLGDRGHETRQLRPGGGFLIQVRAWDPYGAAAQARLILERLVARASFLRTARYGIKPAPWLWVDGSTNTFPVEAQPRGANLISLAKEDLYRVTVGRDPIDAALELAAPINRGAIGPATAGAWAAVESLLTHPDDPRDDDSGGGKVVAADRLAAIIACSWPRAELTALAYHHRPQVADNLADSINVCRDNRDRAYAVAEAISSEKTFDFRPRRRVDADHAAVERMRKVLENPGAALREARTTFSIALRRLYRSRNILLHGGGVSAIAVNAALRTAAPLVGAGLDRIAYGRFTERIDPLDLATRAELALQLVGGETGLSVVDLLEPQPRP